METKEFETITENEVEGWCTGTISNFMAIRLTEILNGTYSLEEARTDILSFRKTIE